MLFCEIRSLLEDRRVMGRYETDASRFSKIRTCWESRLFVFPPHRCFSIVHRAAVSVIPLFLATASTDGRALLISHSSPCAKTPACSSPSDYSAILTCRIEIGKRFSSTRPSGYQYPNRARASFYSAYVALYHGIPRVYRFRSRGNRSCNVVQCFIRSCGFFFIAVALFLDVLRYTAHPRVYCIVAKEKLHHSRGVDWSAVYHASWQCTKSWKFARRGFVSNSRLMLGIRARSAWELRWTWQMM